MARNKYYLTPHWQALRKACFERDGYRCTAPGCQSTERLVCDHIETRPNVDYPTPLDALSNTRTLCDWHDRQVREDQNGKRRRGGQFKRMTGLDGWPIE